MTTTPKPFEIVFTEDANTMLFGPVQAGHKMSGDKKVLMPFVDNGKAKIIAKIKQIKEDK